MNAKAIIQHLHEADDPIDGIDPQRYVDERLERQETAGAQFDRTNAVNQPGHWRVGSEVGQCAFAHRATITLSQRGRKEGNPCA